MTPVTRLLTAHPCVGCGANLLLHTQDREIHCTFCQTVNEVPQSVLDDFEHGRKLPFDAILEMHHGLDRVIENRYKGFELHSGWTAMSGVLGGIFFAWVLGTGGDSLLDYAKGAALGFFAMALPVGWTASWLENTGLGRAANRVNLALKAAESHCPRCEQPIMGEQPGTFTCVMCNTACVFTEHVVIVDDGPHVPRFEEAADKLLAGKSWLDERRGTWLQYLSLWVIALGVATSLYFALTS